MGNSQRERGHRCFFDAENRQKTTPGRKGGQGEPRRGSPRVPKHDTKKTEDTPRGGRPKKRERAEGNKREKDVRIIQRGIISIEEITSGKDKEETRGGSKSENGTRNRAMSYEL